MQETIIRTSALLSAVDTSEICSMTDKQGCHLLAHTPSRAAASSLSAQSSRLELRSSFLCICRIAYLVCCLHQLAKLLRKIVVEIHILSNLLVPSLPCLLRDLHECLKWVSGGAGIRG